MADFGMAHQMGPVYADQGETLTEYAREVADCYPASAWAVADETVMPS